MSSAPLIFKFSIHDCAPRAEVTKALRARKNEKMQRCEAIRQQHEQLRRGDGADQSSSNQVGHRFSGTIFFSCCKKKQLLILAPHAVCRFRKGSRTRTGTGEEDGTGGRRCRASPRPRARAAAASLNPPPANMLLTGLCHPAGALFLFFFPFSDFCLLEPSQKLKKRTVNQSVRAGSIGSMFHLSCGLAW